MNGSLDIAFFGSSLVSTYWNGAATYYRGLIRALYERGHRVTFYEPDVLDRQKHRDLDDPEYARSVVYECDREAEVYQMIERAQIADLVVKASGVGVYDALLERAVLELQDPNTLVAFWDVDAPATLDRLEGNPGDYFRPLIPEYDIIFTYGGGDPVVEKYEHFGAQRCLPIYNALDPSTHYPGAFDPRFEATLSFLGNRLPDREQRVEEYFFRPALSLPDETFLLGGNGWEDGISLPPNVDWVGHVYEPDHNAFYSTPLTTININRDSMARYGFSPPTRVFEAAGAGACLITDSWKGIDRFLTEGRECLVAEDGEEVIEHLHQLTPEKARTIGQSALQRVRSEHTYADRAQQVEEELQEIQSNRSHHEYV